MRSKTLAIAAFVTLALCVDLYGFAQINYVWHSDWYQIQGLTSSATMTGDLLVEHSQAVDVVIYNPSSPVSGTVTISIIDSGDVLVTTLYTASITVSSPSWAWSGSWTPTLEGSYRVRVTFVET